MTKYVRPAIAEQEFRDAGGHVIPFGNRWDDYDQKPDDAYSVVTNPERFDPVVTIAEALIAHLTATYDVDVVESVAPTQDVSDVPADPVRGVQMRPHNDQAAPMEFRFSGTGVEVHAGVLLHLKFPVCGCDACDETWLRCADSLEENVFAIVQGRLVEKIGWRCHPWCSTDSKR